MWRLLFPLRFARSRAGEGPQPSRPSAIGATSLLTWLRAYPADTRAPLAALALSVPAAIYLHPVLLLLVPWYLVRLHTILGHVWELSQVGCVNAGQVVALDPVRVAVVEDMNKGLDSEAPALTVLTLPARAVDGQAAALGQRITCVCAYAGQEDDVRWTRLSPVPSSFLTRSQPDLDRHRQLVDEGEWAKLEHALTVVGPEPITGIHRLGWRSTTATELGQFGDYDAPSLIPTAEVQP